MEQPLNMPSSSPPSTSSDHLQQPSTKRRKLNPYPPPPCHVTAHNNASTTLSKWRTSLQHQIYSANFLRALRRPPSSAATPATQVRHAADTALAVSAKGSTRWSRAILRRRRRLLRVKKVKRVKVTGDLRSRREKGRKLPGVEKRVRVLSRLVPGCRKVSFPNLLEEASDYIAALEMQVKAMAALAEILSRGGAVV